MKINILFLLLFASCSVKVLPVTTKTDTAKPQAIDNSGYDSAISVIARLLAEKREIVVSNCNDTAYLMTIETLNRQLDSAKTPREKRIASNKIIEVLSNRDKKELKELRLANDALNIQAKENKANLEALTNIIKAHESTNKVQIRQENKTARSTNGSSFPWWLVILSLISAILNIYLLKNKLRN